MQHSYPYRSEIHIVSGKSGEITIENLSPQLSDEEYLAKRRSLEEELFDTFIQYCGAERTPAASQQLQDTEKE